MVISKSYGITKLYQPGSVILTKRGIVTTRPPVFVSQAKNLIVNTGLYYIGDITRGLEGLQTALTYHSIGTDATPPDATDTQLIAEVNRKQFAVRVRSLNKITFSAFYTAAESTYLIEEHGIWGDDASATPNSGILFARYLDEIDNQAGTFDQTIDYILEVTT